MGDKGTNKRAEIQIFIWNFPSGSTFGRRPKLVKTERNAKQKTKFFVSIAEVHPNFGEAKVQTERKTKQTTKFLFFLPEVPPNFGEAKVQLSERKAEQNLVFRSLNRNFAAKERSYPVSG